MAPQRGTARSVAMAAITDTLRARPELAARVVAGSLKIHDFPGPGTREDLAGDEGAVLDQIWVQDSDRENLVEIVVFTGADPVNYDETVRIALVIQAIRRGDQAAQVDADQAVEEMWGEVIGALASAPQIVDGGPTDPTEDGIEAVIVSFDSAGGWLRDRSGFLTRFVAEIECSSRFALS